MRRLLSLMTAMMLFTAALPSLFMSLGEFGIKAHVSYRLEFAAMIIICAAYFLPAYAAGYAFRSIADKDDAGWGPQKADWIGMAATYGTGFAYYLVGRPIMPEWKVIAEHVLLMVATWLGVVIACWLVYGRSPRRASLTPDSPPLREEPGGLQCKKL